MESRFQDNHETRAAGPPQPALRVEGMGMPRKPSSKSINQSILQNTTPRTKILNIHFNILISDKYINNNSIQGPYIYTIQLLIFVNFKK